MSPERIEILTAERDRAVESLKKLVRQLERIRGYASHEDQTDLRDARALLVEVGK